jgi:hypothetical protein
MNLEASIAFYASVIACVFGGGLGLYAMIDPGWASRLVRLVPAEGKVEGRSEFRATYGGLFFLPHAFVVWALLSDQPGAALASGALGAAWIGAGLGRLISFALDRTATPLNRFNVAIETALGLALAAPFLLA